MKILEWLKSGYEKLRKHPQLWYTILVALLILASFIFVADRFVSLAQKAQSELFDIRMSYLQSSFVRFAPDYIDSKSGIDEMNQKISRIMIDNETISEFHIVKFNDLGKPVIVSSANQESIGKIDEKNEKIYDLLKFDNNETFRVSNIENGGRVYYTVTSVTSKYGELIGAVFAKQALSTADKQISNNINQSAVIFVVIVILIMFLFFRHARIIDYVSLYKRLQEVDELKDDFISMASHELRTPLTVIRGYAENLREAKEITSEMKTSAERIDIAAKQLDDLVADMLDVSRIEQGRIKMEPQNISVVSLLQEIETNYVGLAKNKGLNLILKNSLVDSDIIFADLVRLKQVLVNLVGNAIKYTPSGEVLIESFKEGTKIIISVKDTGLGISAEEQKHLFEKFYRIQNAETQNIRGTGLGLWITKQMVELMQGRIYVESMKGVGTRFVVEFPIVD